MEEKQFGLELQRDCLEVVKRDGRYYVRYDAGSQQMVWREDEITEDEAKKIASGRTGEYEVIIGLQRRLGLDAYTSNWTPPA
jgi:hypothetical protein